MATQRRTRLKDEEFVSERPAIDFLILADRAEGINGKLYMMGGAWTEIRVRDFSQPLAFSLSVGVLVLWNATNKEHALEIRVESDDGTVLPPPIPVKLNMGRPPQAIPGQEFRSIIAINGAWKLPGEGTYRVTAELADGVSKRTAFRALAITAMTQPLI